MRRNLLILFCTFGLLFFVARTTMAQESTVEAAPIAILTDVAPPDSNTTVEDGGTVINIESPTETPTAPVDNSPAGWIAAGLALLVSIIVSVSLALQVVGNRADAIAGNPAVLATLEQGYDVSVPDIVKAAIDPLKESLERSDKALQSVIALVGKLTDGVPELSKPAPPQPVGLYTVTSSGSPTPPNQDGM